VPAARRPHPTIQRLRLPAGKEKNDNGAAFGSTGLRRDVLLSLIQAAGWPIWFLIVTSIAAVALIIERSLSLKSARVLPPGLLDEVLEWQRTHSLDADLIRRLEASSPLGRVLASGLRHRRAGREERKDAMEATGRVVAHDLERYLSALGTIAAIAPLLGLFGTVIGMIEIFGAQGPGTTDPQQLAHGISVALYNTALGILIAIPAMIAFRHFRARVDGYLVEMEQQATRLVERIGPGDRRTGAGERNPRK